MITITYKIILFGIIIHSSILLFVDSSYIVITPFGNLSLIKIITAPCIIFLFITIPFKKKLFGINKSVSYPKGFVFIFFLVLIFTVYSLYLGYDAFGLNAINSSYPLVAILMLAYVTEEYYPIFKSRLSWSPLYKYSDITAVISLPLIVFEKILGYSFQFIDIGYYAYGAHYIWIIGMVNNYVLYFKYKSKIRYILLLITILCLLVQFEKKLILPALVCLIVSTFFLFFNSKKRKAVIIFVCVSSMLFTIVMLVDSEKINSYYSSSWENRYLHANSDFDYSGGRLYLAEVAVDMIKSNPWGYGSGVRITTGLKFRPILSPHNTYLYFMLSGGLIYGILMMFFTMQLLHITLVLLKRRCKETINSDLLVVSSYLFGFFALACTDMYSIMDGPYLLFAIFVGIVLRQYKDTSVHRVSAAN